MQPSRLQVLVVPAAGLPVFAVPMFVVQPSRLRCL